MLQLFLLPGWLSILECLCAHCLSGRPLYIHQDPFQKSLPLWSHNGFIPLSSPEWFLTLWTPGAAQCPPLQLILFPGIIPLHTQASSWVGLCLTLGRMALQPWGRGQWEEGAGLLDSEFYMLPWGRCAVSPTTYSPRPRTWLGGPKRVLWCDLRPPRWDSSHWDLELGAPWFYSSQSPPVSCFKRINVKIYISGNFDNLGLIKIGTYTHKRYHADSKKASHRAESICNKCIWQRTSSQNIFKKPFKWTTNDSPQKNGQKIWVNTLQKTVSTCSINRRGSTSMVIRETQVQPTMRGHPLHWLKSKGLTILSVDECGATGTFIHHQWRWKMLQPTRNTVGFY